MVYTVYTCVSRTCGAWAHLVPCILPRQQGILSQQQQQQGMPAGASMSARAQQSFRCHLLTIGPWGEQSSNKSTINQQINQLFQSSVLHKPACRIDQGTIGERHACMAFWRRWRRAQVQRAGPLPPAASGTPGARSSGTASCLRGAAPPAWSASGASSTSSASPFPATHTTVHHPQDRGAP